VTGIASTVFGEQAVAPAPVARFFDGNGSDDTGCNELSTSCSIAGDKVTFGEGGSVTNDACEPANAKQEATFMSVARGTATFEIEGDTLTLGSSKGEVVFTRHPPSPTPSVSVPPADADAMAQNRLFTALNTAKGYRAHKDSTYEGLDLAVAADLEPTLTWNADPTASVGAVSIRDVSPTTVLLVAVSTSGKAFCIADARSGTIYGTTDAQTVEQCSKPAWPRPQDGSATPG